MKADTGNGAADTTKKKRTRSRFGCHNCKRLKVKCDEKKPSCSVCLKSNKQCDYSIQLTWGGRPFKKNKPNNYGFTTISTFQQESQRESKSPTPTPPPAVQPKVETLPNIIIETGKSEDVSSTFKSQFPINQSSHSTTDISSEIKPTTKPTNALISRIMDSAPSLTLSEGASPRTPATPSFINKMDENQIDLEVFKDIETTNIAAKEFLNDCVIPDLESFGSKYEMYVTDLGPRIKELEEYQEDLLDDESIFSQNAFSNISQIASDDHIGTSHDLINVNNDNITTLPTGYEFIPFAIVPLPDMLLKVPFFRENYHAYVEVYSKKIVPAPPSTYMDNPLTCIIPRLSLSSSTDGMLSVIIACSIVQGSHYRGEYYSKETVNMLLRKALQDLYNRLIDPQEAESDYTLALIMLLSCFEILCGDDHDWRSHYYGARKIILSRGLIRTNEDISATNRRIVGFEIGEESDVTYFFARWFAYTDVISSLSSSSFKTPSSGNETHLIWRSPNIKQEDKWNLKDIDPFMGFDLRLLNSLGEVVNLVKEREHNHPTVEFLSPSLIRRALEIKESMIQFLSSSESERDEIVKLIKEEGDEKKLKLLGRYRILRATNRAFTLAGILQIYRRILMMPAASSLVQNLVKEVFAIHRDEIPTGSPAACCSVFSLFTTGCDAIDENTRYFFSQRILQVANEGLVYAGHAHEIMLECWETGKYWADLLTEKNIDLTFV